MDSETWENLYAGVRKPALPDTVVGFNLNLDRVLPVTRDLLDSGPLTSHDLAPLRTRLVRSMQFCTAEEWFVKDHTRFRCFSDAFRAGGSIAAGGQAGIAALNLAGLGAGRVVCAAPRHSPGSARILARAGVSVPDLGEGMVPDEENTHLVFEYAPGFVPPAPGILPRQNRFIVSPLHAPESVLIPDSALDRFMEAAAPCTRGFFSGYQYLRAGREFKAAAEQLRQLGQQNRLLRTHIEWVSVTDRELSRKLARYILPAADSLGLNGQELLLLTSHLGMPVPKNPEEGSLGPVDMIRAALALCRETGLARLHVHTYGYYILVSGNAGMDPAITRNALLYAAEVTAERAANGTGAALSPAGIAAAGAAAGMFRQESAGIFRDSASTIIVIPALIAGNTARTTGLGDILSSTAFVADIL